MDGPISIDVLLVGPVRRWCTYGKSLRSSTNERTLREGCENLFDARRGRGDANGDLTFKARALLSQRSCF